MDKNKQKGHQQMDFLVKIFSYGFGWDFFVNYEIHMGSDGFTWDFFEKSHTLSLVQYV